MERIRSGHDGKKHLILIAAAALAICAAMLYAAKFCTAILSKQDGNANKEQFIFLTEDNKLMWKKDTKSQSKPVTVADYSDWESIEFISMYDSYPAFFSEDGSILYFFERPDDENDIVCSSLMYVKTGDLAKGKCRPGLVDENVVLDTAYDSESVVNALENGGIIYKSLEQNVMLLKYFNGEKTETILEGPQMTTFFNDDHTLAYVCVKEDYFEDSEYCRWYRMEISGKKSDIPAADYVCEGFDPGLLIPEQDLQAMADMDRLLCVANANYDGDYKIDLYVKGKHEKCIEPRVPWSYYGSITPFLFDIRKEGDGISFCSVKPLKEINYDDDIIEYSFYRYKGDSCQEISEDLRFKDGISNIYFNDVPCNRMSVNDEIYDALFSVAFVPEDGSPGLDFLVTEDGENCSVQEYTEEAGAGKELLIGKTLTDKETGKDLTLCYKEYDDYKIDFWLCSEGKTKQLTDRQYNSDFCGIYLSDGEEYLFASDENGHALSLNLDNLTFEDAQRQCAVADFNSVYFRMVPYLKNQALGSTTVSQNFNSVDVWNICDLKSGKESAISFSTDPDNDYVVKDLKTVYRKTGAFHSPN